MGGKTSRNKGKNGEYQARDYFRSIGMLADRVPSSGAAQGFPGDIKVIAKDGSSFLVEVKFRKIEFKSVYEFISLIGILPIYLSTLGGCLIISNSYDSLYSLDSLRYMEYPTITLPRTVKKLFTMKKWVKGSDILMIKNNNKPFLFIRYLK